MNKPLTQRADEDSLRIEFEVSPELKEELDKLKQKTGLSYPQIYSRGLTLLRVYSDLKDNGIDMGYVDESGERRVVRVPGF